MIRPTAETKAAIIADYIAGMSVHTVARKWSVSASSAHRYVMAAGASRTIRSAKTAAYNAEYGLSDGHWMPNTRGVQQWQPCFYDSIHTCTINHQENVA